MRSGIRSTSLRSGPDAATRPRHWRFLYVCLGVAVLLTACWAALSAAAGASAASSHRRRHVTYCSVRSHPRGCIAVPKSAHRPGAVDQQGDASLTPPDAEDGGGLGGGP